VKSEFGQITPPGLYIIATPIGNRADMSERALAILQRADMVLCEDTRVSGSLLSHFGIKKPLLSYHDHNEQERAAEILAALERGQLLALVSDAGTPLISDPGYKLVREAIARGYYVTAIPGPSSVLAALCISGLPSDRFFFAGFLPSKTSALHSELESLAAVPSTLVFFESARRLQASLQALHDTLGNRPAAVVRELTKLYEEARRGTLAELIAHYDKEGEPKGEVVLVVGPPLAQDTTEAQIEAQLSVLLASHSVKEAASILAEQTGKSRKDIYTLALKLSGK
jgi:16S rRNA (cytidine1402-2'-O)-methyltransferase